MNETIATYSVQVLGPNPPDGYGLSQEDKRVLANLPAMCEAVEEDLTDMLPEGYTAKLTEWSDPQ